MQSSPAFGPCALTLAFLASVLHRCTHSTRMPCTVQVHNTPEGHVTRDYKEGRARLGDMDFCAIDTSGLEPFMDASSLQVGPGT